MHAPLLLVIPRRSASYHSPRSLITYRKAGPQDDQHCTAEEVAALDVAEKILQAAPRPLPPYNGFGSLEDSAQSCRSLIPQVHDSSAWPHQLCEREP